VVQVLDLLTATDFALISLALKSLGSRLSWVIS
jgi:hypothetical protein